MNFNMNFFFLELDSRWRKQIKRYSTELHSSVIRVVILIFRAAALKFIKIGKSHFHLQPLFGFEGDFNEVYGNTVAFEFSNGKRF